MPMASAGSDGKIPITYFPAGTQHNAEHPQLLHHAHTPGLAGSAIAQGVAGGAAAPPALPALMDTGASSSMVQSQHQPPAVPALTAAALTFKPPAHGKSGAAVPAPDVEDGLAAEDYEDAALRALLKRKKYKATKKKPAAAAPGSDVDDAEDCDESDDDMDGGSDGPGDDIAAPPPAPHPKSMKTCPAKRPASLMKRPAGKMRSVTLSGHGTIRVASITLTAAEMTQTTRNLFCNKWYRLAGKAAKVAKIKNTAEFSKLYYKRAADAWDSM